MDTFPVTSTKAVFINADSANQKLVTNVGGTLYYKASSDVSTSSSDGTIATGASATFTTGEWVISASQSSVTVSPVKTGTVGSAEITDESITSADIKDGTIVNADLSSSAAVAVSKLAPGTSTQVLLNNATPAPTWTTLTGDVTVDATGATTLVSPTGSARRTLLTASSWIYGTPTAGTFILGSSGDSPNAVWKSGGTTAASIANIPPPIYDFAAADFAVTGKTAKMQLRAVVGSNDTASAITWTFSLRPLSTITGSADNIVLSVGSAVSGSTVAVASPAADTITAGTATGDFTIPSDGQYVLGCAASGTAGTGAYLLSAVLQLRYV